MNNNTKLIEIKIEPTREMFYKPETGYGIYKCEIIDDTKSEWDAEETTITGNMPKLNLGKTYIASAEKINHKQYGEQYKVHSIYSPQKSTYEEEQDFLKSLVTERQFNAIVKIYKSPVTAIMNGDFNYKDVYGVGEKTYKSLKKKVEENFHLMKALSVLGRFGIGYNVIKKIVDEYGNADMAVKIVMEDPYVLYRDIKGIGFLKADSIAQVVGIEHNSPKRLYAGIMYALEQEETKGNTYGSLEDIRISAEGLLGETFDDFVRFVMDKDELLVVGDRLTLKKTYRCEQDITQELFRLFDVNEKQLFSEDEVTNFIDELEQTKNVKYTDQQKELFYAINKYNVVVLTGYAGTGKTFTLSGCLKMLDKAYINYALCAPTGKAAKQITKYSGMEAATIHRTLGFETNGFKFNKSNPLITDMVIVDESSMCDIWLFRSLMQAIRDGKKLLLIGDPAQLESVSTGNVLHDIINSEVFPVVRLNNVFRQALDSGILHSATEVRQGRRFYNQEDTVLELGVKKDMKLWCGRKEQSTKRIEMVFRDCLKRYSIEDIMVISPMKKGETGVKNLNTLLQSIYNPPSNKKEIKLDRCTFRVGDKVKHTKNDYNAEWLDESFEPVDKTGIFNGEFGVVKDIDPSDRLIYVDYGDKIICYEKSQIEALDLAYAITCHSSQGSQSPVIIGTLDISHYMNLKRSLLYTMITRASEVFYLVGEQKAISMAISNNAVVYKKTFLKDLIETYNSI